jgi:hypothetical protein
MLRRTIGHIAASRPSSQQAAAFDDAIVTGRPRIWSLREAPLAEASGCIYTLLIDGSPSCGSASSTTALLRDAGIAMISDIDKLVARIEADDR